MRGGGVGESFKFPFGLSGGFTKGRVLLLKHPPFLGFLGGDQALFLTHFTQCW